ncbi:hypothetical protein [Macrococcoides caseolyticum]|uniref:hypothetical protein n=1 Tax=Macrococcoides caseolyticum TaxID=69966 RepID=UPI000C32E979|nr:hypothetical protein [Macrococcus caseolyticus]PKD98548.1 hypothetical protein CW719_07810 [Macrococcus caseolyticus]PKF18749.1 hypothetical protein CW717_07810 [Macrococcus caseolyticus]
MTYTTNQIVRMIKDYQMNVKVVAKLRKEYIEDVCGANISQYGIEATMPKPQGQTSDPILREVQRLMKQDTVIAKYEAKVRYIQNRWDRITDEKQAMIFNMVLSGVAYEKIAKTVELSAQRIHQIINEIAEILKD